MSQAFAHGRASAPPATQLDNLGLLAQVLPTLPFGGGVLNIPFVTTNAAAVSLNSIFWIETVAPPAGSPPGTYPTMQLQYTQTVILNFLNISWPHISVATLVKH